MMRMMVGAPHLQVCIEPPVSNDTVLETDGSQISDIYSSVSIVQNEL